MNTSEEFYVGYRQRAPVALGRWLRGTVVVVLLAAVGFALLLVTRQGAFGPGMFEFGVEREFTGLVLEHPLPLLQLMDRGGGDEAPSSPLLLSAFGKSGAGEMIEGMHGRPVRVRGSLIYRDGNAMVEAHEIELLDPEGVKGWMLPAGVDRGTVTLSGEIVDSKCFLGVMKPGHTKAHRACAVRCISGGVPPLMLVVQPDGSARHVLLASPDGAMIQEAVLPFVAEQVEIRGRLRQYGDLEVLLADPDTYRRLP